MIFVASSCTVQEKPKADEKIYVEETESLDDVSLFVKDIDYKAMKIPTEKEIKDNPTLEDDLWKELVAKTTYIRMPKGYEDNFALRKFLSVEYIYNTRINGIPGLAWDDECKMVKEFLVKRIFEKQG